MNLLTRQGKAIKVSHIFVIAGPSGVGKTTVIKQLLETYPEKIVHPLTYTTRNPRAGEVNGRDMNFIPRSQFTPRLLDSSFIAHTEYQGELYGTLKADLLNPVREGRKVIVAFDVEGVRCLKESGVPATFIYIVPPSLSSVKRWLTIRWPEGGEEYEKRIQQASAELSTWHSDKTFQGLFDWALVSTTIEAMSLEMAQIMGLTR